MCIIFVIIGIKSLVKITVPVSTHNHFSNVKIEKILVDIFVVVVVKKVSLIVDENKRDENFDYVTVTFLFLMVTVDFFTVSVREVFEIVIKRHFLKRDDLILLINVNHFVKSLIHVD